MKIVVTQTFEQQMQDILENMLTQEPETVQSFKIYLDTILLNIPTKAAKYKQSTLMGSEHVQEIEHEGYKIPFYHDKQNNTYVILGIIKVL
ncbi:MAG: hypothetical protein FAF05_03450 [Epsilonproteobacteria bacterium]|nr:hypothetical protein [Campylobacterota bacterium]